MKPRVVCPNCGGKLYVTLGYEGSGYMAYQIPDGFQCQDCYMDWDVDGNPIP